MSEFSVNVVKIDKVEDHPDADRLTVVTIGGYNCVANKKEDGTWRYQTGDMVVYIPENALMPEWLLKRMGFWNDERNKGMLSGSKGRRLKPIRLRGIFSEGILYPVTKDMTIECMDTVSEVSEGDDVAELLGIVKYEPQIPTQMAGKVKGGLFGYTVSYDIENYKKYSKTFEIGDRIVATEKLHGTFFECGIIKNPPIDCRESMFHIRDNIYTYVTSKGLGKQGIYQTSSEDNRENIYVKAYLEHIHDRVPAIIARFKRLNGTYNRDWSLHIMGEVFGSGVQDLSYGLNAPSFRLFDVFVRHRSPKDKSIIKEGYLDFQHLVSWSNAFDVERVPVLYRGPFINMDNLIQYRDGQTTITDNSHIREGIVIRLEKEVTDKRGLHRGRAQVKFINPDYLLRKNGSEYN